MVAAVWGAFACDSAILGAGKLVPSPFSFFQEKVSGHAGLQIESI